MRSQEQTSTTPPQKPKGSEGPGFLGCYAGKSSQCTPWKICTSQHNIMSQTTWILSSFFSVADLEDSVFVTKVDAH
jgi:preprotein translocase subunit SecG